VKSKTKKNLKLLIVALIILAGGFVFMTFLSSKTAIKLSCEDGSFIGFGTVNMPLMCAECMPSCRATAVITDKYGKIICESGGSDEGTGLPKDNVATIACPRLKKYEGQELILNYSIISTKINLTNEETIIYDKRK
jgi:hypothetical protein